MIFETPLCELAYKYGSDKCPQISHGYTPRYHKIFKDKRNEVLKVFEIGIGIRENMQHPPHYRTGASLYMWRDYFPNAQIYGMDILPECMFEDDRIHTFLGDQSKKDDLLNVLRKIGTDIDLVIDDGSHQMSHQLFTCLTLMPYLRKYVTYVIEDVVHGFEVIDELMECGWNVYYRRFNAKRGFGDRMVVVTYPKL
jgi:hypothetical protein